MFYKKIQTLCKEKGISVSKLCKDIGLVPSAADRWKKGSKPTYLTLLSIAGYFNVDEKYLMDERYIDYDEWLGEDVARSVDEWEKEKTATTTDSGLDENLVSLLKQVPEDKIQRVKDFVAGLIDS